MLLAVHAVMVRVGAELPALVAHHRLDDIHRDDALEALELAKHDRAMRPRAGKRDVEVIAPARSGKSPFAARSRAAVRRHPVAEFRLAALEASAACLGVVKAGVPDTIDQFAVRHQELLILRRRVAPSRRMATHDAVALRDARLRSASAGSSG